MISVFRAHFSVRSPLVLIAAFPLACAVSEDPISSLALIGGAGTTGGSGGSSGTSGGQAGRGTGGAPFVTGGSNTTGGATSGGASGASGGAKSGGTTGGGSAATTGGSWAKGGSAGATGGNTSGGFASGGAAGAISGGNSGKGGAAGGTTGGTGSGGTSASKGGAGSSTGGSASGGAASGGAASGGAPTGGSASGGSGCGACLVHRYSFAGTGTAVTDSVGTAHGTAVGTTLASGAVPLSGTTSDQYVNLPSNVLSGLTSVTIETWVTWNAGSAWQRIFDFGSNSGTTAGAQGPAGVTYLLLSPKAVSNSGKLRVAYSLSGPSGEVLIDAANALPSGTLSHVAVVIDDPGDVLSLYLNGASVGSKTLTSPLSSINAANNWLGRSQFQPDPEFGGQIHEFRIYASARSSSQIQASFAAGADVVPTN